LLRLTVAHMTFPKTVFFNSPKQIANLVAQASKKRVDSRNTQATYGERASCSIDLQRRLNLVHERENHNSFQAHQ
jgi:hypothetical protein